jgi:hypothetical protein
MRKRSRESADEFHGSLAGSLLKNESALFVPGNEGVKSL